jgi:acyl carrier protein
MHPSESSTFSRIASELSSAEDILREIQSRKEAQPSGLTSPDLENASAPRTPTERKLAEIWVELLGLDTVGIRSNFFDLGGHSLLAMQVLSRVREVFHVELPLRVLFTDTFTIAELARAIQEYQAEQIRVEVRAAASDSLSDHEAKAIIEQAETQDIVAMLEELDRLSDDEIQALLASQEA